MPTYTFFDEDTKETFDMFLSMAEREKYLKANPQIRQVPALKWTVGLMNVWNR